MKKKWFVVYTRSHQELKVSQQLTSLGITNYCPTVTLIKQYSDRRIKVNKPLLPSYVMVFIEESHRNQVFSCSGVVRYLFFLGKPAVVRSSEISLMQDHLNGVYSDIKKTTLSVGETLKITQGPLTGISGTVVEINKSKVKLQLEFLGMSIILKKQAA